MEIFVSSPEQVRAMFLFESSSEATALHPFLITFLGRLPLLSLELEFGATRYFPHRVLRQFGLDQGIPTTPSLSDSLAGVFHTFLLDAATLLPSLRGTAVYIAGLGRIGTYDASFYPYWAGIISSFREYSPEPLSPDASRKFVLDSPDLFSTSEGHPSPAAVDGLGLTP